MEVREGDLVSLYEIAKMAGVDYVTAEQWSQNEEGFPRPIAEPVSGRLYSRKSVEKWLLEQGHHTVPITL